MTEPSRGWLLLKVMWPLPLAVVVGAFAFTGHLVLAWTINAIIFARVIWLIPGMFRAKKAADRAMVDLVDHMLDLALVQHHATGSYQEYCRACGPGTVWPCARYLEASVIREETPKTKRKWLMEAT